MALGLAGGWNVDQMDVLTAFMYEDLEEETFVEIPQVVAGVKGMVWKLLECLYGLKMSPRMWNQSINKVLEEIGFVLFKTDNGVDVFWGGRYESLRK